MTSRSGRVAAAALIAVGVITPATAVATADPVGSCSASRGVFVAVDLRRFGGSITRGCDATPSTGYDALHAAGFTTAGTQHDGPAFVCRIDGRPTAKQDPCVRTPPASAYWSYWHANPGQSGWTYSSRGAQSSSPGNGSVDAWVFGATDVGGTSGGPTFTPAEVRAGRFATGSAPTTAAPRSTSSVPRVPASSRATGSRSAASGGRTPSATPSTSPSRSTAAATTRPSATSGTARTTTAAAPPPSASVPQIVDAGAAPPAATKSDSGSALPAVLVGGLVLILAGGAGVTVLRRRRADDAG